MPINNGSFLDKDGLSYLWTKLKALFSTKQDTLEVGVNMDSTPTVGSHNPVTSVGILSFTYGSGAQIPSGADLNDYYNPGSYRASSNAIAASLSNCPTSSGFRLEVLSTIAAAVTGYQLQRLYPNNDTGEFFMRRRLSASSGEWGEWKRYANDSEIPTVIQNELDDKQDTLTVGTNMDSTPTASSDNPITSGGVYNAIDGMLTFDGLYGLGTTIPNGANLNNYYTPGVYNALTGAVASSLSNCPTTSGFRLEVFSTIAVPSSGYQVQRLIPNNSNGEFFMRRRLSASSGNWANWYKFHGEEIVS